MHQCKKKHNELLNIFSRISIVLMLVYLIAIMFVFFVVIQSRVKLQIPQKTDTEANIKNRLKIYYGDHGLSFQIKPLDYAIVPGNSSIFFIESHTGQAGRLSIRQMCSVESAARINPDRMVFILLLTPTLLVQDHLMAVISVLKNYNNVHIRYIDIFEYADNTPFQNFVQSGAMHSSIYPLEHTSDMLRVLTLWKFGGIYLDLDMISLKPIPLINFFSADPNVTIINNSAIGIQSRDLGERLIHMFTNNWNGTLWNHNGAGIITTMMKELCGVDTVSKMIYKTVECKNVTVFPIEVFYPLPHTQWPLLFDPSQREFIQNIIKTKNGSTVHLWNSSSISKLVTLNNGMPFEDIVKEHCPNVYDAIINTF